MSEEKVFQRFREFYMTPEKMLCFYGLDLQAKTEALDSLVDKQFLIREEFAGAFSLTQAGYEQMQGAV